MATDMATGVPGGGGLEARPTSRNYVFDVGNWLKNCHHPPVADF
jgi:hypothetical protein